MKFFTLVLMGILVGAEIDLFVPSFPELERVFHLTPFLVELTLGVNLIAHCISALIVGNLGDKYGRKSVIVSSLLVFTLGSLFCVFASEYYQLLLGRFFQGIGISGPAVLAYVILADMYSVEKQQKIMGILNGIITLSMAFAPVVGSYVNLFFNWRGNFAVLLIIGIVALILSLVFIKKDAPRSNITLSLKEYLPLFKSKKAIFFILTINLFGAVYWIFIGISPILYMDGLGVGLEQFGFYQGAIACAFSLTSFSSAYFLWKFGQRKFFYFGISLMGLFFLLMVALIVFRVNDPLLITCALVLLSIGVLAPMNILWPMLLEAVPGARARLSALSVATRLIMMAVGVQIASFFYNGTFFHLGILMCLILLAGFWTCYKLFGVQKIFPETK